MWGHYADSHKGFCLEYDFQSILKECTQNCIDIRCCNNFMLNYSLAPIIYTKERFDATAYFSTVMQALLYEKGFGLSTSFFAFFVKILYAIKTIIDELT